MLIAERLAATRAGAPAGYGAVDAFERDLQALRASLRAGGAPVLADGELPTSPNRCARSGSTSHRSRCASTPTCSARPCASPTRRSTRRSPPIAAIQAELGEAACHRLVISFTRSAEDVAAAYALARRADPDAPPGLDVVCLFESGAELARATDILDEVVRIRAWAHGSVATAAASRSCSGTQIRRRRRASSQRA